MANTRKPGARERARQAAERQEKQRQSDATAAHGVDTGERYRGHRQSENVTVSARIAPGDREAIEHYAAERGLKTGQVIRSWILERLKAEGLR